MAEALRGGRDPMTYLTWTSQMSVGVPELDDDHKNLIHIINQLAENAGDESRYAVVRQCLVALMRYAETHFAREEQVMSACGFPGLEVHQGEHRDFLAEMKAATARFEKKPEKLAALVNDELLGYLKNWLNHHILIEDMAYRPFAERKLAEARRAAQSFRASEVWRGA